MKHLLSLFFLFFSLIVNAQEKKTQELVLDSLLQKDLNNPEIMVPLNDRKLSRLVSKIWELESKDQRGTFRFLEYQPMYILPFRFTNRPVKQPIGLNSGRPTPEYRNYQQVETKFQVSLKAKIMQDAFGQGDVWVAFTQQAYWQMYNGELSRPFRELNYEPELIFTYPLNLSAGAFQMRMIGLSINHQSNGKEENLSRSWNRFILMGVFQWGDIISNVRLWRRFSEKSIEDDNPEIEEYIGRAEMTIAYPFRKNLFRLSLRNNLNFNKNKSHLELSWVYPLSRDLRVVLQASHGYGDSLVDYNYKQTIFGVGFTFLNL